MLPFISSNLRKIRRIDVRHLANNVQHAYLKEPCIIVDEKDRPLHSASKEYCHSSKTLSLHRAFSVFLFDESSKLILQKRSAQKITFPSVWTNACCSHPLWTEQELSIENGDIGVRRAARRKLKHELGIDITDLETMQVMGRFLYKAISDEDWGEYELDHALIIRYSKFDCKIINAEEVEETAVVSMQELRSMLDGGKLFSPWFRLFVQHDFLQIWWQNLDRLQAFKDFNTIHRLN